MLLFYREIVTLSRVTGSDKKDIIGPGNAKEINKEKKGENLSVFFFVV